MQRYLSDGRLRELERNWKTSEMQLPESFSNKIAASGQVLDVQVNWHGLKRIDRITKKLARSGIRWGFWCVAVGSGEVWLGPGMDCGGGLAGWRGLMGMVWSKEMLDFVVCRRSPSSIYDLGRFCFVLAQASALSA
jgi:hypothetical protein